MGKLRCLIVLSMLVLPVCGPNISYYVDISPKADNDIYEMANNSTATFQVEGFQKDDQTGEVFPVSIEKAWWSFDKNLLTKISSDGGAITLRAVRAGSSELSVNAMLNNRSHTKGITILVREIK